MPSKNGFMAKADEAAQEARKELRKAQVTGREMYVRDASAKAWLAVTFANNALFSSRGVPRKDLPKGYRGIRHFLSKHATRDVRKLFEKLYAGFHLAGYYSMDEVPVHSIQPFLEDLSDYLKTIRHRLHSRP